jgi:hypothetical protein
LKDAVEIDFSEEKEFWNARASTLDHREAMGEKMDSQAQNPQ